MVEPRTPRINQLEKQLPEGLLVDGAWLEAKGIASNLRAYYVKSGWLDQPVRGVYRRPRGSLSWQQAVISLQALLEKPFFVGGRTALELQGFAHYISEQLHSVYLYGPSKTPSWLSRLELPQRFIYRNSAKIFRNEPLMRSLNILDTRDRSQRDSEPRQDQSLTSMPWGQWDWPLTLSRPERAYLELLDELPNNESFHQADVLMESAANFSPRRLQQLLADCTSVKVKRLFFFFADRHNHAWLKRIDKQAVDLGSGKRMLVKGGRLDPKYLITVPENLDAH